MSNLLYCRNGELKLCDLGLARCGCRAATLQSAVLATCQPCRRAHSICARRGPPPLVLLLPLLLRRRHFQHEQAPMTPRVVTLWYRAPELLLGSEVRGLYGCGAPPSGPHSTGPSQGPRAPV